MHLISFSESITLNLISHSDMYYWSKQDICSAEEFAVKEPGTEEVLLGAV